MTSNGVKVIDIIFALIFGRIIGFLIGDFLREWNISIGFYWALVIWLVLPLISLCCLWIAYLMGRKFLFIFQGAKYLLVGAVATVIDLKTFEFLVWFSSIYILAKVVSFIISTFLKYWGNKYWTFQKHEKEDMQREMMQFFIITLAGLIIDVSFFYYFSKIMGTQFGFPTAIWIKLSVIFAAFAAALWNFLGYKFFVFKK